VNTTLNLGLRIQAYLYPSVYIGAIFVWKVPIKYLKVCTFSVLLGNDIMFVCKYPIRLLSKVGRFHDVSSRFIDFGLSCSRLSQSWSS